jgi:hypothetical protein
MKNLDSSRGVCYTGQVSFMLAIISAVLLQKKIGNVFHWDMCDMHIAVQLLVQFSQSGALYTESPSTSDVIQGTLLTTGLGSYHYTLGTYSGELKTYVAAKPPAKKQVVHESRVPILSSPHLSVSAVETALQVLHANLQVNLS